MASRRKTPGDDARPLRLRSGQAPRIIPNKNRKRQIQPATGRKLFGKKAKAEFLEWFAATCNASLSARKAGFNYRTAFRHRREDPEFAAGWDEALAIGYVRLEELALRGAEAALAPKKRRRVKGDRPAPPETLAMDAMAALQLLREHKRGLGGVKKPGRAPGVASNDEVYEALVKRLKAFGIRVRDERGQGGGEGKEAPPPGCTRSPSPGKPGED